MADRIKGDRAQQQGKSGASHDRSRDAGSDSNSDSHSRDMKSSRSSRTSGTNRDFDEGREA